MYVPAIHSEHDPAVLRALIEAHPLGAWVTFGDGELIANHIPFVLDTTRGEHGTLMAHVARANRVWQSMSTTVESVVMFRGSDAYITPSWYPSKHAHGKAVPTWNYAVVHAHGLPRVVDDREALLHHVTRLTESQEGRQALPWKVSDAPADYIDRLLDFIVGIEVPVTRLVGKWKTSQNRPAHDQLGVIAGLTLQGDDASTDMADWVRNTAAASPRP